MSVRSAIVITSYTFDLAHSKDKEYVIADASSHLPLPPTKDHYDQCRLLKEGDVEVYTIASRSGNPVKSTCPGAR